MKFDKGRRQIVVFLIFYLLISATVFLTSFEYLSFKKISDILELRLYSLFSIIAATGVFFYTKSMFKKGSNFEKTVNVQSDKQQSELERKEQERQNKELKRKQAEEEKKFLTQAVAEIAEGLEDKTPQEYFDQLLINLSKRLDIVQGVAFAFNEKTEKFFMAGSYAYYTEQTDRTFELGEGIPGQVAKDMKILLMDNIPEDYIRIVSGLGTGSPKCLLEIPIVYENKTVAVLELASFEKKALNYDEFLSLLNASIGELSSRNVKSL